MEDVSGTASPLLACFAELFCTICEYHGVTTLDCIAKKLKKYIIISVHK